MPTEPQAPAAFLDLINNMGDADCVIGSRWIEGAVLHRCQTGRRQFASRIFHGIVQMLFMMNIRDTQCGAKPHAPSCGRSCAWRPVHRRHGL